MNILSRQLLLDLSPEGFEASPEVRGVGTDRHVEEQLVPTPLPDDEARLAGRLPVEKNLPESDCPCFGDVAKTYRDPLDIRGAANHQ